MEQKKTRKVAFIARAGVIAALYVALTLVSAAVGLASGPVQVRLSEALCVLPYFTAAAVPGLFVGCALANLVTGAALWDVVIGSLATLAGATGTRLLRRRAYLAPAPPILANALVLPPVLIFVYGFEGGYVYFLATILLGEFLSCGVLGTLLLRVLEKARIAKD